MIFGLTMDRRFSVADQAGNEHLKDCGKRRSASVSWSATGYSSLSYLRALPVSMQRSE